MTISLSWRPFQERPYGEDHYDIPHPTVGPVDATVHRHYQGGWYWFLFGNGPAHTDDEGNQYPLASGRTSTYQQAQQQVQDALNGSLPAVSLRKDASHA